MMRVILNKSWKQHLFGYSPPISQTVQLKRANHTEHCKESKDKFRSEAIPWTTTHGLNNISRPTKTYIHQYYADKGCRLEDKPIPMANRDRWRETVKAIPTISTP